MAIFNKFSKQSKPTQESQGQQPLGQPEGQNQHHHEMITNNPNIPGQSETPDKNNIDNVRYDHSHNTDQLALSNTSTIQSFGLSQVEELEHDMEREVLQMSTKSKWLIQTYALFIKGLILLKRRWRWTVLRALLIPVIFTLYMVSLSIAMIL